MREPSFADAYEVLCLQAADHGRGPILFGDSVARARAVARPFVVGGEFPDIYFEFPLAGDPFLDVTFLYHDLKPGTRIDSPAAVGSEDVLDWFAAVSQEHESISFGFELDTSKPELPRAAMHFQPRVRTDLVEPFFEVIGEPERARIYLDLAARMPDEWSLSFFGLFRGRPDSPLRVCGYLSIDEWTACSKDPGRIESVFDRIGFSAYDDPMLERLAAFMGAAPKGADFQFDVYPDGSLGDTFAIDVNFAVETPEAVLETFEDGPGARVMELLEGWGAADERWKLVAGGAFARAIPVVRDDGSLVRYSFTLMPGWMKARWRAGVLQPAKFYYLGKTGILE